MIHECVPGPSLYSYIEVYGPNGGYLGYMEGVGREPWQVSLGRLRADLRWIKSCFRDTWYEAPDSPSPEHCNIVEPCS